MAADRLPQPQSSSVIWRRGLHANDSSQEITHVPSILCVSECMCASGWEVTQVLMDQSEGGRVWVPSRTFSHTLSFMNHKWAAPDFVFFSKEWNAFNYSEQICLTRLRSAQTFSSFLIIHNETQDLLGMIKNDICTCSATLAQEE